MRKKILVADDDTAVRESLINALSYENYLPLGATSWDKALELMNTAEPDLVLLDVNLPGRQGWAIFEQFISKRPSLPIIALTARSGQPFAASGAAVSTRMEKPFDFFQLLGVIRDLLHENAEPRWRARFDDRQPSGVFARTEAPFNPAPSV